MKTLYKPLLILCLVVAMFALPSTVLAQTPPPPTGQTLNGDQMVIGNTFHLTSGQTLNGNLVIIGGTASIDQGSKVNGDVALTGGTLQIAGEVTGDVALMGGTADITNTAVIDGELNTIGATVNRDERAIITGGVHVGNPGDFRFGDLRLPTTTVNTNNGNGVFDFFVRMVVGFMWVLLASILAVLAVLIMPVHAGRAADTLVAQPIVAGAIGLLTLILSPFVIILLSITIILIPVALLAVLALFVAILLGWITFGYEIGRRIEAGLHQNWAEPVVAGVGTFVLAFVSYLFSFIPCVGWMVTTLLAAVGLGAVILSRFGTQVSGPRPSAGAIVPAPPAPPAPPTPPAPIVPADEEPIVPEEPPVQDEGLEPPAPLP